MTDLNMSLWGLGGFIILSVVFYNFWQEYKAKRNVERAFGENQNDVLMQSDGMASNIATGSTFAFTENQSEQRHEPTLNDDVQLPQTDEPVIVSDEAESQSVKETAEATAATAESELLPVDEFIDCVIPMEFDAPIRGDKILSETQSLRRVGNKPVHFVAINTDGKREIIEHAGMYVQLCAGVQLVTRSGALNELEYSECVMKLREIADNLGGHLDIPDMKHVMDSARDLYLFVSEYDAQLSVNIHTTGAPWGTKTLLAALQKQGFDARPEGRMAMSDCDGGALYMLSIKGNDADETTSQITLLLDVPSVAPFRGAYNAMISCAKSLALRLGGRIVDDTGEVLSEETLDQIQEQVELFYTAMQAAEIPAGSVRATRLFS